MLKRVQAIGVWISMIFLLACATTDPRPGAEQVKVAPARMGQCHWMGAKEYFSPPIGMLNREGTRHNLVIKAKNDAVEMESDTIFISEEPSDRLKEVSIKSEFYQCGDLQKVSNEGLKVSCENGGASSCRQLAVRHQAQKNYREMVKFLKLGCDQGEKYSCSWIVEFERKKEDQNRKCAQKVANACFAKSIFDDVESKDTDLRESLKIACDLKSEEACFYQKLALRRQTEANNDQRMTIVNLTAKSLADPQVKSLFDFLDARGM